MSATDPRDQLAGTLGVPADSLASMTDEQVSAARTRVKPPAGSGEEGLAEARRRFGTPADQAADREQTEDNAGLAEARRRYGDRANLPR